MENDLLSIVNEMYEPKRRGNEPIHEFLENVETWIFYIIQGLENNTIESQEDLLYSLNDVHDKVLAYRKNIESKKFK